MSDDPTPLQGLLRRLDLEQLGTDLFVGVPGKGEGALFGGMVAAQSVVAAGRTVHERQLHSLHGYFLRPGRHAVPIHFSVDRIREGRTFSTRSVVARQQGEAIFSMSADFTCPEEGIAHQDAMPPAPEPANLPDWEDLRAQLLGGARRADGPVEVRVCDPESTVPGAKLPAYRRVWMRPRGTLPEEPLVHAAVLVYASDRTLLRTAARPHGVTWRLRVGASLDHAVWVHHPARFDDWLLFVSESPVAYAARALLLGAMYRRDGVRVASVAQEGLLRL
ncbi:MAG TPA: acyl-CoA thioesterase II [Candidatus Margulisiibacteriota bacterium]|nr:acyl-CoA thioesterase II [Candidatus Margulisiibacteriota bacterium]